MASQVPPNKKPTPYGERPLPPSADLETPDDYKNTFKVSLERQHDFLFPVQQRDVCS